MTMLAQRFPAEEPRLRITRVRVTKKMQSEPVRCVVCLEVEVVIPAGVPDDVRASIEAVAGCTPVGASLDRSEVIALRATTAAATGGGA